jgi:hypothetical protein
MRRDVDMHDAPPVVSEHDEDEQDLAGDRRHGEEVDGKCLDRYAPQILHPAAQRTVPTENSIARSCRQS